MTDLLKRMKETHTAVAIYYKSVGSMYTGFVNETDEEFALLDLISPSGRFDGYTLIRTEEILKLDAGTNYLNNLVKVYRYYGERPTELRCSARDVFSSFLETVIKNKWLCTMEIGFETLEKISGFILDREWDFIDVLLLDESGARAGFTRFDVEDVVGITVGSEYEKFLGVLYSLSEGKDGGDDDKRRRTKEKESKKKDGKTDDADRNVLSFPAGK